VNALGSLLTATLLLLTVGLLVLWTLSPGRPTAVRGPDGKPVPGSISEKVFVSIHGVDQGMFIISKDPHNPVMLVLHGGLPEYFLAEKYGTGLEELFTVVWWEQRGSGLSFSDSIPKQSITPEQLIADTVAVTNYLRERFEQRKIFLMAHSGGTFFGIQAAAAHPELYHAYIGIAQYAHQIQSEKLAYDYMLREYKKLGNKRMVEALQAAPVTLKGGVPRAYLAVRDRAMHELGIGTARDMHSIVAGLFLPSLSFRGYTLLEKLRYWRGKARNGVSVLWDRSLYVDISERVPALTIPVYFMAGVYDYTCNYHLSKRYFDKLRAPLKGFYTFQHSAHSPHLEEPAKMRLIVEHDVIAGTNSQADPH
jgi:pimeloyl-ACP methyl ester carboxylesterase